MFADRHLTTALCDQFINGQHYINTKNILEKLFTAKNLQFSIIHVVTSMIQDERFVWIPNIALAFHNIPMPPISMTLANPSYKPAIIPAKKQ